VSEEMEIREKLQAEVAPIVARAQAAVIVTPDDYLEAGEEAKAAARMLAKIDEICDPVCSAAFKAHKAAVALKKSLADPVEAAKKLWSDKQLAWSEAVEAKRVAEEQRLQAIEDERVRREQEKIDAAARAQREKEAAARAAEEAARAAGDLKAAAAAAKAAASAA